MKSMKESQRNMETEAQSLEDRMRWVDGACGKRAMLLKGNTPIAVMEPFGERDKPDCIWTWMVRLHDIDLPSLLMNYESMAEAEFKATQEIAKMCISREEYYRRIREHLPDWDDVYHKMEFEKACKKAVAEFENMKARSGWTS